eukprot:3536747-Prymnesium_polylepis.1
MRHGAPCPTWRHVKPPRFRTADSPPPHLPRSSASRARSNISAVAEYKQRVAEFKQRVAEFDEVTSARDAKRVEYEDLRK